MAETERVALFKEFARAELLTALREAGGDELQKEHVYLQIREAFNREHSWPEELDEIEPGQARMPRWRNRLHWVVAELVRRGLLEPSEGQDLIRPTSLGRAILRLPAPFRDTPETRTLIEAVQSAVPDEQQNGEARQALADFWKRFPSERLADLSLDEYASGSLGPGHFCWWLESGLGSAGSYSLGSPRNRLIYRDQSGEVVCIRSLRNMPVEEAMNQVASWHAEVVAWGDRLDGQEDSDRAINLLGQSRTLKLLHSYFPDRFLPINSMDHMARFLRAFGVPEEGIPDLAVGRNRLLFRLYESLGQPRGLKTYTSGGSCTTDLIPVRSPSTRRASGARSACSPGTTVAIARPTASCARNETTRWRSQSVGSRLLMSTT